MAHYTKEEVNLLFLAAPEKIRELIFAPETTDYYDAIAKQHSMTEDQRTQLAVQTGHLLIGILTPNNYVRALSEKLGLPRNKAIIVAQEINRDILNPVKNELKDIHMEQSAPPAPVLSPLDPSRVPAPVQPSIAQQPEAPKSAFEQKLGGAFRITGTGSLFKPTTPAAGVPAPTAIIPPAPLKFTPPAATMPPSSPMTAKKGTPIPPPPSYIPPAAPTKGEQLAALVFPPPPQGGARPAASLQPRGTAPAAAPNSGSAKPAGAPLSPASQSPSSAKVPPPRIL